jgi:hypothetical protein
VAALRAAPIWAAAPSGRGDAMNAAASGMTAQAMAATAAQRDIIACPLTLLARRSGRTPKAIFVWWREGDRPEFTTGFSELFLWAKAHFFATFPRKFIIGNTFEL